MAKCGALISALCILAFATIAYGEVFDVKGLIYCDPCKLGFTNEKSYGLKGATVELTCSSIVNGTETFKKTAVTDDKGEYVINVKHDHADDVCEVRAVNSGSQDCKTSIPGTARIECTKNSGLHSAVRFANALGFIKDQPIAGCKKVVDELDLDEIEKKDLFLSADELAKLQ